MDLISWLNRTFQTNILSAPQVAMAGGAEGVSVVHPIEAEGSTPREEPAPSTQVPPGDASISASEGDSSALRGMANDMKEAIATYSAANDTEINEDEKQQGPDAEDVPILRLAKTIIQQAIKERASSIHIEPLVQNVRVRYRIDGILQEAMPMPNYLYSPLLQSYKVMTGVDIATHRGLPQEGRVPIRYDKKDYDILINTQPTQAGEHLVLHIKRREDIEGDLSKLGLVPNVQAQLENLAGRRRGLLLIAGPPGSGKTTTQYRLLKQLETYGIHIATVEERATHRLPGMTQIVVDRQDGGTPSTAIRAAMLQDIDVLGIGEIRDKATAQAAMDVAASALVIATIRGDDALSTLIRLREMGLDAGLIAETVCGVVAQRLVRKICPPCKETYEVAGKELRRFGLAAENPEESVTLARGVGCEHCRHTGYHGRVGLYEVFEWEPTLTKLFADRAPLPHLKEAAFWNGRMHGLKEDALVKILAQMTTPEEILRML